MAAIRLALVLWEVMLVMFSNGPPHIAEQKQGDQLEPTYMNDREMWRERVRDICAGGTT